ncbi:2-oxo acid dehydrogenase [Vitiosangium sp. GDMCC 1.1324]|nr:2-oxo acid dehydrogenase [Vitiosangium sp. GDMCC 1.1324]
MERALAYVEAIRAGSGQRLTVTHLVAKAAADAVRRYPEANAILRWNRPWLRKRVSVCVLVVQPEPLGRVDLTTATVPDADVLSLQGFAAAMEARVQQVRHRRDTVIERGKRRSSLVPGIFMNAILRLLSFVWYTLNVDLAWVGMPRDPFGSIAVSNVGSLGLERAWLAMVPYTRVALYLAPGAVRDAPVLEGDSLVPGKLMTLSCTFDARLLDHELVSRVLHHIGAALQDPESAWGPPIPTR